MDYKISGATSLYGLFGSPVTHSLSPKMHNLAFQKLEIDSTYLAFDVTLDTLEQAVASIRALHMQGINVTMPCKSAIVSYLDQLTPAAQMAGAVNTIINRDGILTGHITDGEGYLRSLYEEGYDPRGEKMTILGAGGAAMSICVQAVLDGVKEISIFNRSRIDTLADQFSFSADCNIRIYDLADIQQLRQELAESYLLVNCTSVGMGTQEGNSVIEDVTLFHPELLVTDIIYQPEKTKFLELAESAGCNTMNGLGMILYQGAASFRYWTGQEMPVTYVKEKLFK